MEYLNHTPAKRSGFVTGIAWTFIALAGFATIIAILQLVMLSVLFSGDEFQYAIREAGKSFSMPPFVLVIFENFRFIFMSLFALSAATLVAVCREPI